MGVPPYWSTTLQDAIRDWSQRCSRSTIFINIPHTSVLRKNQALLQEYILSQVCKRQCLQLTRPFCDKEVRDRPKKSKKCLRHQEFSHKRSRLDVSSPISFE